MLPVLWNSRVPSPSPRATNGRRTALPAQAANVMPARAKEAPSSDAGGIGDVAGGWKIPNGHSAAPTDGICYVSAPIVCWFGASPCP